MINLLLLWHHSHLKALTHSESFCLHLLPFTSPGEQAKRNQQNEDDMIGVEADLLPVDDETVTEAADASVIALKKKHTHTHTQIQILHAS